MPVEKVWSVVILANLVGLMGLQIGFMLKNSPAVRKRLLLITACASLAVVLLPVPKFVASVVQLQASPTVTVPDGSAEEPRDVQAAYDAELADKQSEILRWTWVLLAVWLATTVATLVHYLTSYAKTIHVVRGAEPLSDERLLDECAELADSIGLGTVPNILVSDLVNQPMAVSAGGGSILLPAWAKELDPSAFESVITHELVHLKNRDPLMRHFVEVWSALVGIAPAAFAIKASLFETSEHLVRINASDPDQIGEATPRFQLAPLLGCCAVAVCLVLLYA